MDFYEVLAHVIELLQREGRASYRALKRQFTLDDDYLEDLKDALLYAYPQVVDDGRGLRWTDDGAPHAEATSTPPARPSPVQHDHPTRAEPPPAPPSPDAERRQLTVMFCDLVGSTPLSERLDPEDLREVVRAYQQTCTTVVQRFDGHVAQLLGDALLIYFGWPQAHEDDAQRAVRTGLGMLEAMQTLNVRLEQDTGIRVAMRVGIHTGLVVVGAMGGGGHQEQLALGDTPNVAARLQGLADPDTVAISAATYRLIQGYFACEDLGLQRLKGVAEPVHVHRVRGESGAQSRVDIARTHGLTPLVGRASEVTFLLDRWHLVTEGQGQTVLVSGEGGIGKSRLVQVVKDHTASENATRLECRSSLYYQHTALYPITDLLHRTLRWQQEDTPEEKLAKLEQTLGQYRLPVQDTVPLFAVLLSLPVPADRYPPLQLSPQRQRQQTLESIVAILLELAAQHPVLFILEDLHWTDPTTLELLDLLIDQTPTASLYALLTCRPAFQPRWSPRAYLTQVTLNRLSRPQIARMAAHVAGEKRLPAAVLDHITAKTDGVPLFVEEMTKAVLESGYLKAADEHYALTGDMQTLTIPATLQDTLTARLDRLGTAKAVAQYAAVIGRQFSYAVLHAVSPLDATTLQHELGRLVEAELIYQRGMPPQATYLFKHALVVDAAYQSLLKRTRQQYHQRIAQVLEAQFPETVDTQPELLAYHCTAASLPELAVGYWYAAGQQAIERSAHVEAISHLNNGLVLLRTLPETPEHLHQELALHMALGPAFIAAKGFSDPQVEAAYLRARDLCHQIGDQRQLFVILRGLCSVYNVRADFQAASAFAEELLIIAQQDQAPLLLTTAHYMRGTMSYWLGAFGSARTHLEAGMRHYHPPQHWMPVLRTGQDPGVGCLARGAEALWMLGFPDQAIARVQAARQLAHRLSDPFTVAFALANVMHVLLARREVHAVREQAEAAMAQADEHGFPQWWAFAAVMRGWALAMQGQGEAGIGQIQHGLTAWRRTNATLEQPHLLALLAEAQETAGHRAAGLTVLDEALAQVERTSERSYEAEIRRLKGRLLLSQSRDNGAEAETCFYKALDVARSQEAKAWELRAAMSLARLWQSQGRRQAAYDLLAPVYNWFTEGFDTADLQEAKALLEELS